MKTDINLLGAAIELLQADLVWSSDFEAIRVSLLEWLKATYMDAFMEERLSPEALKLAKALLEGQDDA